jgi:hypothetical protein
MGVKGIKKGIERVNVIKKKMKSKIMRVKKEIKVR